MKIVNIDKENFHIFWKTWETSMKFQKQMFLMITLAKSHKKTGL